MPIETRHPLYDKKLPMWQKCRDCMEGEDAVKERGEAYLPKLTDQDSADYNAYKARASFFGATKRTRNSLTGAAMRKEPTIRAPKDLEEVTRVIGPADETFTQFTKMVLEELIGIGRVGLLCDQPEGEINVLPYITLYSAESIINWRVEKQKGYEVLTMVVLREEAEVEDPNDAFQLKIVERYRLLQLLGGGDGEKPYYHVEVHEVYETEHPDTKQTIYKTRKIKEVTPKGRNGRTFDYIPFVFLNPFTVSTSIEESPMLDIANVNLSHYRTSADLEHGRHLTALPTAVVTGYDNREKTTLKIGSSVVWVFEGTEARADFLEFTGAGLGALAAGLAEKEDKMAALGARLLEDSRPGVESAEAIRIRYAGEKSALVTICRAASQGLGLALQYVGAWVGLSESEVKEIEVKVNEDYGVSGISPAIVTTLLTALQSGQYSIDDWFWFLKNNDLLPEDRTLEQFNASLKADPPGLMLNEDPEAQRRNANPTGDRVPRRAAV